MTVDVEQIRAVLADPKKWQGIDKHGAYIRSLEGPPIYVHDTFRALLDERERLRSGIVGLIRGYDEGDTTVVIREEVVADLAALLVAASANPEGVES